MATIGDIVVNIRANTKKLTEGVKRAKDRVKDFGKSISRNIKSIMSWQRALLGVAGVAGIGALIKSNLEAIDSLAKTSDKLGTTTEELASLRHAANQTAGVTSGTLDMALQRMTRRIAEAAQGTGEAKNAIIELGLSAEELNRVGPAKAFAKIADAMQNVRGKGDQLRLAFKLFDSEGAALVNTLRVGSAGLRQFAEEADRLGIAIGRGAAAKVEVANDAIDRMSKAFQGLAQQLTIALTPTITDVAGKFEDFFKNSGIDANRLANSFRIMAEAVGNVGTIGVTAFVGLAETIDEGRVNLVAFLGELGKFMQLSPFAHARQQGRALEAEALASATELILDRTGRATESPNSRRNRERRGGVAPTSRADAATRQAQMRHAEAARRGREQLRQQMQQTEFQRRMVRGIERISQPAPEFSIPR